MRIKLQFRWVLLLSITVLAGLYLFVTAPAELPDGVDRQSAVPAEVALSILNAENAAIRKLYTREIVDEGKKQGLKFREDWKKPEVQAGPLPALLLRETSNRLQMQMPELSLFLGSDYPIVKENLFKGEQAVKYQEVKATQKPVYFYDPALGRVTAMFPDLASAKGCVSCHNEHPQSPKTDWELNEPMGATTWSYAGRVVPAGVVVRMVEQLRASALDAYGAYLKKIEGFDAKPEVGSKWPRDGFYVPDLATFRRDIEAINSPGTLNALFAAVRPDTRPSEAPAKP